jgi:sugar/nucleoside kinase (ribokinase family)
LVGVDEEAAGAAEFDVLESAGVLVRRVPLRNGPVFENIDRDGHRRQRWLSKSDPLPVAALPDGWRGAAGWMLVPVAGEMGEEWATIARAGFPVSLGWQGLLRHFDEAGWVERLPPGPSRLLEEAGLVCASFDDLTPSSGMEALCSFAPRATIVMTAGARGGAVLRDGRISRYPAMQARAVDPTGAGDVFMAGLMAAWLLTGELATSRALRFAAAASAITVEDIGLAAVPTAAQVAARLRSAGPSGL